MICARLVNITLESNVCPYRNCPHTSLISWWTWHFHGWYVFNLSISQWKVTYLAIAILSIYVWVLGGPGVESFPLDDTLDVVSSTGQCHNRSSWISLLGLSLYMFEEYSSIWCVLQRGYMSTLLIRYVLKARGSKPWAPKRIYEYIPIRYVLKVWESIPWAPRRIYEYIPY